MSVGDLIPLITGGGGAIVALVVGIVLIMTGKLVTGREHDRLLAAYDKAVAANDTLTISLQACRENNSQLLASGNLTTKLLDSLVALSQQRGDPPKSPGGG